MLSPHLCKCQDAAALIVTDCIQPPCVHTLVSASTHQPAPYILHPPLSGSRGFAEAFNLRGSCGRAPCYIVLWLPHILLLPQARNGSSQSRLSKPPPVELLPPSLLRRSSMTGAGALSFFIVLGCLWACEYDAETSAN